MLHFEELSSAPEQGASTIRDSLKKKNRRLNIRLIQKKSEPQHQRLIKKNESAPQHQRLIQNRKLLPVTGTNHSRNQDTQVHLEKKSLEVI